MMTPQTVFQAAGALYGLALLGALLPGKRPLVVATFLVPALVCNLLVVGLRYHQAWPMLPMHLGAMALPLCLGLLYPFTAGGECEQDQQRMVRRTLLGLMVLLVLMGLCFPKDFYLPFLKSKTMLAHGFLWFGLAGKACFVLSAIWALAALAANRQAYGKHRLTVTLQLSLRWAVWGFALWTLSMFSGELWSYLGWGTPVVWEDPALTLTMAAWFFYACYLHLHLTRSWNPTARALYASLGGLTVLALTCLPDLGPFRAPF
jgi:hypothetical protein